MFGRKRKLDDFTSEIEVHLQIEIEYLRMNGIVPPASQGKSD